METAKQCSDKVLAPKIWIQELIQGIFGLETARCKLTLDVQRKCSSNLRLPGLPFMRHSEPKGPSGVPWRSHLLITSSCSCDAEFLFVKLIWSIERKPLSVSGIWQHMKELLFDMVDSGWSFDIQIHTVRVLCLCECNSTTRGRSVCWAPQWHQCSDLVPQIPQWLRWHMGRELPVR